jgi:hypothetical protein
MPLSIVFVITGADNIPNITPILKRERYIEYMLSLHKLFQYTGPKIGVLSECNMDTINSPPFDKFPFDKLIKVQSGEIDSQNKAQAEFICINRLLETLDNMDISDDTFIVKATGRYNILNDILYNSVLENINNINIQIIGKTVDKGMYTSFFAMRYKQFKNFYSMSPKLIDRSIEYIIFDWIKENNLYYFLHRIDTLGILHHVSNCNHFSVD